MESRRRSVQAGRSTIYKSLELEKKDQYGWKVRVGYGVARGAGRGQPLSPGKNFIMSAGVCGGVGVGGTSGTVRQGMMLIRFRFLKFIL